jgi:hypothetical protein
MQDTRLLFDKVEVDLKAFISKQYDFVNRVLLTVQHDHQKKD